MSQRRERDRGYSERRGGRPRERGERRSSGSGYGRSAPAPSQSHGRQRQLTRELPLRLWADAGGHARDLCGNKGEKCFVLGTGVAEGAWQGSDTPPSLALVLGCGTVAAVVCDASEPPSAQLLRALMGLPADDMSLPRILLRRMPDDTAEWYTLQPSQGRITLSQARELVLDGGLTAISTSFAQCMVCSIRNYYFRQVQEPSVKGFLSLLENAIFPRNDLYLFELLQNAVDDEATNVRFEARGSALRIWHDGHEFSPLDVFGLSSVGFSAKSGRTIGFMGVGFKAVYKRYSRVRVRDPTWAFQFEEPRSHERTARLGEGAASNGWVLMPEWDADADAESVKRGCEFSLELPRGGSRAIEQDLAVLPQTLPPLLGRTAQIGQFRRADKGTGSIAIEPFKLQWGARRLAVTLVETDSVTVGDSNISGRAQTVIVSDESGIDHKWIFVSRSFRQDKGAIAAFMQHTRKQYPSDQNEELVAFFEVDQRGCPKPPSALHSTGRGRPSRSGMIHSTLPTKLSVPMGCHVQSSWLLSIDRMDVQALTDNEWNAGLLNQLGYVCVLILRWIAATHSGEQTNSKARFAVLPKMSRNEKGALVTDVLDTAVDSSIVEKAVRNECLCPIIQRDNELTVVRFNRAHATVRVPDVFFNVGLNAAELEQWLGLPPLASPAMGSCASSPLWDVVQQLDQARIRSRANHLARLLTSMDQTDRAFKAMAILAAFGEACSSGPEETENGALCSTVAALSLDQLPIFLTRDGSCVTAKMIRWPEDDYFRAPAVIQQLLEPHIIAPIRTHHDRNRDKFDHRRHRNSARHGKQNNRHQDTGYLLDPALQKCLQLSPSNSRSISVWKSAVQCVAEAKKTAGTIVSLDVIVKRFFEAKQALRGEELKAAETDIVTVTAWALQRRMPQRISHVLVGEQATQLVEPRSIYIGAPYTETNLSDLAGDNLLSVSPCYALAEGLAVSTPSLRQWREFFLSIGVNEGIRFEAKVSSLDRSEQRLLPDGRLPALRKSQKTIILPYGLGTMTSKQLKCIDVDLSREWMDLLRSFRTRSSSSEDCGSAAVAGANSFAELLARLQFDSATHPDAKSTPSAAAAIAGRDSDPASASLRFIPTRRRLMFLPPGQAGAVLVDLGPAAWVQRMSSVQWVPCQGQLSLKLPKQVSLWTEHEKGYRPGLPLAAFSEALNRKVKTGPLASILGFGTADPPKAIERLRDIAKATTNQLDNVPSPDLPAPVCSDEDLSNIWRQVCQEVKQNKLSGSERHEIKMLAHKLPILPGIATKPGSRVKASRCVKSANFAVDDMSEGASKANQNSPDIDKILVHSMSSVGWLVDMSAASWSLVAVADILIPLLDIRNSVQQSEIGPFVGFVCQTEPAMTGVLRDGLTIAMHRLLRHVRPSSGVPVHDSLASACGSCIKIYCDAGPQALPKCWRSLNKSGEIRAVINDNREKATMLTAQHGFAFAGIWNHNKPPDETDDLANALFLMDKDIQGALHLPRLSSPDFSVRIQTRGAGEELEDAMIRLKFVLHLLRKWCAANRLVAPIAEQLTVNKVSRFKQIVKTFTVPGSAPIKTNVWACWRRGGVILLCADSEDYVAELQSEILQKISDKLTDRQGLYPSKILNLVCHLESARRFAKFLKRDHNINVEDVEELQPTLPPAEPESVQAQEEPPVTSRPAAYSNDMPVGRGRGRGVEINKPAWMTTGELGKPPESDSKSLADIPTNGPTAEDLRKFAASGSEASVQVLSRKRKALDPSREGDCNPDNTAADCSSPAVTKKAKGLASDFLLTLDTETATVPAHESLPIAPLACQRAPIGRGRGVNINKPAWMTTGDLGGQPVPDTQDDKSVDKTGPSAEELRQFAASSADYPDTNGDVASSEGKKKKARVETSPDTRFAELSSGSELLQLLSALRKPINISKLLDASRDELLGRLRSTVPVLTTELRGKHTG